MQKPGPAHEHVTQETHRTVQQHVVHREGWLLAGAGAHARRHGAGTTLRPILAAVQPPEEVRKLATTLLQRLIELFHLRMGNGVAIQWWHVPCIYYSRAHASGPHSSKRNGAVLAIIIQNIELGAS